MSQIGAYPCPPPHSRGQAGNQDSRRFAGRLVAEWISLGVSVLLILGLSAYLVSQGLGTKTQYLPVEVQPVWSEVHQQGEHYLVPIEIQNRGPRTVRDLQIGISYVGEDGEKTEQEATIDYLGEESHTQVFVFTPRHPRDAQLEATPSLYRLE